MTSPPPNCSRPRCNFIVHRGKCLLRCPLGVQLATEWPIRVAFPSSDLHKTLAVADSLDAGEHDRRTSFCLINGCVRCTAPKAATGEPTSCCLTNQFLLGRDWQSTVIKLIKSVVNSLLMFLDFVSFPKWHYVVWSSSKHPSKASNSPLIFTNLIQCTVDIRVSRSHYTL